MTLVSIEASPAQDDASNSTSDDDYGLNVDEAAPAIGEAKDFNVPNLRLGPHPRVPQALCKRVATG